MSLVFYFLALILPFHAQAQSFTATVTLAWDTPVGASVSLQGYRLYRRALNQPYGLAICTMPASVHTCTDTLTVPGPYTYAVVADYGLQGLSVRSNEVVVPLLSTAMSLPPVQLRFTSIPPIGPYPLWPTMTLRSVDSAAPGNAGVLALDGLPGTFWHTVWVPTSPPLPHMLVVDLGAVLWMDGLRYLPRQDGNPNGTIIAYTLAVSLDGVTWSRVVPAGVWPGDRTEKHVRFAAALGRYVQLTAIGAMNGDPWTSVAEIGVFAVVP